MCGNTIEPKRCPKALVPPSVGAAHSRAQLTTLSGYKRRAVEYLRFMTLRPRDIEVFTLIQRHGPLPSHYLYEATKHIAHDRLVFLKRLKKLTDAGLLRRPLELNAPDVFTRYKVYMLTDKAKELLKEVGAFDYYATPTSGGYPHMLMAATITSNIEREATRAGYRFVTQDEILVKHTCPRETKDSKKPLAMPTLISHEFMFKGGKQTGTSTRPTEPDQLFGIDYGDDRYRFFALEADRGTEPLTRNNLRENSILRKILCYRDLYQKGTHKAHFGIPNLLPVFVTTAEDRLSNMIELQRGLHPKGTILYKAIPGFLDYFKPPPLLPELWGKYRTAQGEFDIAKA